MKPLDEHMFDAVPVYDGLKQRDVSLPKLVSFALECAVREVQENKS
jgi:hypothetical protein